MQQTFSEHPLLIRIRPLAHYLRIVVLALPVCFVAVLIAHFRAFQVDDAFITYRYAQSLAHGAGFSYNPGEIVFGATTPLYTLLLALAGIVGLDIPSTSLVLNAISLVVLAFVVRALLLPYTGAVFATATMFAVVLLPGSYMSLGMETLLYTALVYAALLASRRQHRAAILLSACATLTRYDGAIIAFVVLLAEWVRVRRLPWRNGALYALALAPWFSAALWMFGSPLPNTLAAKSGYAATNGFLEELPHITLAFTTQPLFAVPSVVLAVFGGMCVLGILMCARLITLRPLVLWLGLYVLAYIALRLAYAHPWYYYPLFPALLMFVALGLHTTLAWVRRVTGAWPGRPQQYALLLVWACGALLAASLLAGLQTFWQGDNLASIYRARVQAYTGVGDWLCHATAPDSTVAVAEIGVIGWTCPRYIIDVYGLVTPQVLPYVRRGDRIEGLVKMRPDYIIVQNAPRGHLIPALPQYQRFADRYAVVQTFTYPDFPTMIVVYAKLPPAR